MKDLDPFNRHIFDYKGRQVTTTKLDGISEWLYTDDYKSKIPGILSSKTDGQIRNLEVIARGKINRKLKPYTKGKYGELNEIIAENDENLIAAFIAQKLRNPSLVILWYNPNMVKLATPHMVSRISQINDYEKTKADLYQAIEDLEHSHNAFLKESEQTIESVLEKGHNFIL